MVFKLPQSNAQICAWTFMDWKWLPFPWASTCFHGLLLCTCFESLCSTLLHCVGVWDLTYCKDCHLFWPRWLMNFDPSHSFIRSFVRSFLHSFNQSTNQLLNDAGEDDMFWFGICEVFSCRCLLASAGPLRVY